MCKQRIYKTLKYSKKLIELIEKDLVVWIRPLFWDGRRAIIPYQRGTLNSDGSGKFPRIGM